LLHQALDLAGHNRVSINVLEVRYFLHQAVLLLAFRSLSLLPLRLLLVLLLLSLVFLEHLAVVLNFLLKGGVDSNATAATTTLLSEALVFFFELSD
jgi:hypothetical protein